jgi:hypothetical protein
MTPEDGDRFRRFLSLPHIADDDDPESVFEAMVAIAAWTVKQKRAPSEKLDGMLHRLQEHTSLWMGLLLHLATIDDQFFELAKRMAAATIIHHERPAKQYLRMAAYLLTTAAPQKTNPTVARDAALVIGIAISQNFGFKPTEAGKNGAMNISGCGQMVEALSKYDVTMTYENMERIWGERIERLRAAHFAEQDISNFFTRCSWVKLI